MNYQSDQTPRILVQGRPAAHAQVRGNASYPNIMGDVFFYPFNQGSLVLARITGLPGNGFLGFHIHEHGDCSNEGDVPLGHAGGHFNPHGQLHPDHSGDLPVLLSSGGQAYTIFYTDRFRPQDVINRAVIIHDKPDDYRSQPAGDSGTRIACGRIEATK